jgi:hypothetical protein
MKKHSHFFTDLAAGFFLLGGSLILAQTTTGTEKAPTATVSAPQATNSSTGSGNTADSKSLNSAHATEAVQKKHIAGVKYEDRAAAAPASVTNGTRSEMGINEQGVPSKPVVKPNAMAIKENGISSSKPVAKPHQ